MLHEARTDISMLLLRLIFLLVAGSGNWAIDSRSQAPPLAEPGASPDTGRELPGSGPESFA
jgi:hypothetical protein